MVGDPPAARATVPLESAAQHAPLLQPGGRALQKSLQVLLGVTKIVQRKHAERHVKRARRHRGVRGVAVHNIHQHTDLGRAPLKLDQCQVGSVHTDVSGAPDKLVQVPSTATCKIKHAALLYVLACAQQGLLQQVAFTGPVCASQFHALHRGSARYSVVVRYRGHHVYKRYARVVNVCQQKPWGI
jgi:hypothetical protein